MVDDIVRVEDVAGALRYLDNGPDSGLDNGLDNNTIAFNVSTTPRYTGTNPSFRLLIT